MREKKQALITCPICGMEYLPAEIYMSNGFFGNPYNILRDENGKIIDYVGNSVDYYESFICNKCNSPFKVRMDVKFVTAYDEINDFNKDYTIKLNKDSLIPTGKSVGLYDNPQ